jgi:hypothetical protein
MKKWFKFAAVLVTLTLAVTIGACGQQPVSPNKDAAASGNRSSETPANETAPNTAVTGSTPDTSSGTPAAPAASPVNAAATSGEADAKCRQEPLTGVSDPKGLEVKEACKTVSGTVESVVELKSGNERIVLKPDKEFADLINEKNTKLQHGNLVVEIIPLDKPNIPAPKKGEHVGVTGAYVLDKQQGWMAIAPAWIVGGKGSAKAKAAAVQILEVSPAVHQGEKATVKAKVAPGSTAKITVHYKSGDAVGAGLEPKKADNEGNVEWTWKVGEKVTPGKWPITVSTKTGSASGRIEIVK